MKIVVSDEKKRRTLHKTLKTAIEFFSCELSIPNIDKVNVSITYNQPTHQHGKCWLDDKKSTTMIEVNGKLSELAMIVTLAHEMVHVNQYATGTLSLDSDNRWVWKELVYTPAMLKATEYRELPWEQEAWQSQNELALKYLTQAVKDLT